MILVCPIVIFIDQNQYDNFLQASWKLPDFAHIILELCYCYHAY